MKLINIIENIIDDNSRPILDVKVTSDNKLNINGLKYRLQIDKGFLGWLDVNVNNVTPYGASYKIEASLGPIKKIDIVPSDTLLSIKNNLGKEKINLGGKTPKRIIKDK